MTGDGPGMRKGPASCWRDRNPWWRTSLVQGAEVQDGPPMLRCPGNRLDSHGPTSGAYGARRTAWRCAQACHRPGDELACTGVVLGLTAFRIMQLQAPTPTGEGCKASEPRPRPAPSHRP